MYVAFICFGEVLTKVKYSFGKLIRCLRKMQYTLIIIAIDIR